MSANSKASQLLNWFGNFMNGVSNAARDVVANPIADIANVWLKTNPYIAAANLATKWKVNKAIDTVTSAAKWEQPSSLQKQPNDPTSIAQAAWEWLVRWVDAAASVLTLADLARQLPKAAQAGWKTILNKVKDAKSKSQQMKLAKEAREYINSYNNPSAASLMQKIDDEVPAYQQRYLAEQHNATAKKLANNPLVNSSAQELREMEKYTWLNRIPDGEMRTLKDATKYTEVHRWIDNVPDLVDPYRTFYAEENIKNAPYAGNVKWPMIPNNLRWRQWVWSVSPEVNEQIRRNAYRKWTTKSWETGEKFKQAMKNNKAKDIWFKDMSEATNTFIETKAPFNSVKEMLDYIITAKKPTKWIYPKSFVDRPDIMKFSGWDWSLANIADAQEKYNWYMNSYPNYLERIRNKNNRSL